MPAIEWFPYLGPNRRSDLTVVEIRLDFGPTDAHGFPLLDTQVKDLLVGSGVLRAGEKFPQQLLPVGRMAWYTSLLVQTALLLQCKAGHRVGFFSVQPVPVGYYCLAFLEHEHCDVGMTAVKLAWEVLGGRCRHLADPFRQFKAFARERLLPLDTEAIIKVARANDIPCIHLERHPRKRPQRKADCIRLNGLLQLGHGRHKQILDGTFCTDKSSQFKALLKSSKQRQQLLKKIQVVCAPGNPGASSELSQYHALAINGQLIDVRSRSGKSVPLGATIHDSIAEEVLKINRVLGHAPMTAVLRVKHISKPLTDHGGGVVDFELAPNLENYFAKGSDRLPSAAQAIIDWLFPSKGSQRIPIVAITGTNGKTTTSRMVNHILLNAGHRPGLVCTDGIFLNGQKVVDGDNCTISGHFEALSSKAVDFAVLETHHFGILEHGFMFRHCDVAICLNVTGDHLGVKHINSVEEMAEAKGSLLERARRVVILNADDPNCQVMLQTVGAEKICLISMRSSITFLLESMGSKPNCFCLLEKIRDQQWLVLYEHGQRLPVLAVGAIPATFNGAARFNISNAMHAVAACYLQGVPMANIRTALSSFGCSYENTPGRLNVFDDLPFRIIMDFAHNPDGVEKLCDFIDQQPVTGRRVVAFAGTANRKNEMLIRMGQVIAGHFDFYFCKEHIPRTKDPRKVAHLLQQGLLNAGVDISRTAIRTYGRELIFEIFDYCGPGDLLVMLMGEIEKHQLPHYISDYSRRRE